MRRFGFIAVAALALVALAAPVVDARQGSNNGSSHRTASVVAHTNTAVQGGALHIVAKVKHARRGASFSATATVHFASGDVTVPLKRHGKSFVAAGNAPVNSDETPGTVPVDVTVTYDETDQEVETDATVEDDQGSDATDPGDDQGDAPCDPATTTCAGDQGGGDQGDQTCDPATTTCDGDQGGDQGDQGGDDGGTPGTGD